MLAGAAGATVSVTATAVNSFAGTVAVAITGLPAGVTANPATLSLAPGVAQSTTLTAALTAATASATVTFTGTSGSLAHSASLALTVQAAAMTNAPDVTTYHYDVARDGLNAKETILTPANVNSTQFGKIGFDTVDGKVDAQPLYLANVPSAVNCTTCCTSPPNMTAYMPSMPTPALSSGRPRSRYRGDDQRRPRLFADHARDRDHFDAGDRSQAGSERNDIHRRHEQGCERELSPAAACARFTTGAEISGSPTEIPASYPGTGDNTQNGNVVFDPSQYAERAALLLLNGNIYTGWTSHCDQGLYTGWVMAYSETTLQQTQVLNVTPNGHEGSIWMSGDGLAADSNGNIYLSDANGTFDTTLDANGFPTKGDYGNAMVKLVDQRASWRWLTTSRPINTNAESADDLDLGLGRCSCCCQTRPTRTATIFHLIVGAGKDKNILSRRPRQPGQIQLRHISDGR